MEKFLLDLLAMLGVVEPDIVEPEGEFENSDRFIGVLPDDLRKWYAVYTASRDVLDSECEAIHYRFIEIMEMLPNEPTDKEWGIARDHKLAHDQYKILTDLFWLGVKQAFPELAILPDGDTIGICRGWKVVVRRRAGDELTVHSGGIIVKGVS